MDETILLPSPNWFQVSGLAVANDGWVAYGGPSKSLCVLEPLPRDYNGVVEGTQQYTAHVMNRAHPDKIVSVAISPSWPCQRVLLTGSASGSVKEWRLEKESTVKIITTHSNNAHNHAKEAVVSVGYSTSAFAITVGSFGNIIKWDLKANVVKSYNTLLKTFKPTCMAVSPHIELQAAIGTKQGVLFVVDLKDAGSILYKVRSHDDEIMSVSWCVEYEVCLEKVLDGLNKADVPESQDNKPKKFSASDRLAKIRQQVDPEETNTSAIVKNLPEDSFEDFEVVQEDDMFDIYKDHEADEFGHKKYTPEDIIVKIKEPEKELDYLAECSKLKEDILKKKAEPEPTIESLVEKLNKADLNGEPDDKAIPSCSNEVPASCSNEVSASCSKEVEKDDSEENKVDNEEKGDKNQEHDEANLVSSKHIHKHLLVSIGKYGGIRIWSKSGKQVASGTVAGGKKHYGKVKQTAWATLLWCRPDLILIADGKNQLLQCNPLKLSSTSKLETKLVHSVHKRGVHCVGYNAGQVWTVSQDRFMACHSLKDGKTTMYNTCGGFIYNVQGCPYDASKMAISVGDGAVRVWSAEQSEENEGKVTAGSIVTYWQHVQGKVLTVAWHPFKENMLAFGTAESRVGIIDTSSAVEKPARALAVGLNGGVYSLCWSDTRLYAVARGELVAYSIDDLDAAPTPIPVHLEGAKWGVTAVRTRGDLLFLGSQIGGVCVVTDDGLKILAAAFPFSKIIHTIELHPVQTTFSDKESPNKNMLALCSQDKFNSIIIMEFVDSEDGGKKLQQLKTLCGHSDTVLQLAWSPHHDGRLLTTSHDGTVQVWNANIGSCMAIFGGHGSTSLSACWSALPAAADYVYSGGADCCLRVWDINRHPASEYGLDELMKKYNKKKKKEMKESVNEEPIVITDAELDLVVAAVNKYPRTVGLKNYLAPLITKQMSKRQIRGVRRLFQRYYLKKMKEAEELRAQNRKEVVEGNGEENLEANSDEKLKGNGEGNLESNGDVKLEGNDVKDVVNENGQNSAANDLGDVNMDEKIPEEKKPEEKDAQTPEEEIEDFELEYVKIFGTMNEVNGIFELEMERHLQLGHMEAWIVLSMFRGHIDAMIKFASEKNIICPFLLSIAPSVSSKYWKDVCRLYISQIDRLVADGEAEKLTVNRQYGGPVYRKTMMLLSLQDVKGAVNTLCEARLFKEAYLLCRIRYIDTIAEEVLQAWAKNCVHSGQSELAAMCYIALGDLLEAATVLGKCNDQECLAVAAELAKAAGQTILSQNLLERKANVKAKTPPAPADDIEEVLEELPSRAELLMIENKMEENNMEENKTQENNTEENNKEENKMEETNIKVDKNGIDETCEGISEENGHGEVVNGN